MYIVIWIIEDNEHFIDKALNLNWKERDGEEVEIEIFPFSSKNWNVSKSGNFLNTEAEGSIHNAELSNNTSEPELVSWILLFLMLRTKTASDVGDLITQKRHFLILVLSWI